MAKNILKIFLRKVSKQLGFFSFQLIGLVTGITVFLIVFSFYQYETSYETQFSDYQRIYRIEKTEKRNDLITQTTRSSRLIPQLVKSEIPEVEEAIGVISGAYDVSVVHYPENKAWSCQVCLSTIFMNAIYAATVRGFEKLQ